VLLGEAMVDLALERGERVVPGRELRIGVGIGLGQRFGRGGVDVALGVRIDGRGGAWATSDALVAAGGDAARGRAIPPVRAADGHRGQAVAALRSAGDAALLVAS